MVVSSCCFSDVSVTSQTQGCLGGVWVTLRWCIGDALVISWSRGTSGWCLSVGLVVFGLGDVPGMVWWCLCHVWVMSRSCLGLVSVVSRSRLGDVSVLVWCGLSDVWRSARGCLDVSVLYPQCAKDDTAMFGWCSIGDVSKSVLWWWCLRVALVMSRWRLRLRDVSVVFEWRYGDVSLVLWWCLGPVWGMSGWCLGDVSVLSCLGDVPGMARWCLCQNGVKITCIYRTANQNPLVAFWDFNIASTSETAREQARQTNKPTNIEEK